MTIVSSTMFIPNMYCTLQNMDHVQFVDDFYSNLSYKNTYNPYFQTLFNTSLWPIYIGPNV
jgi:hypothetical protein